MKIVTSVAIIVTAALTACASPGPQASGTFQTRSSSDRLFNAARDAVPLIGYHITSASRECPKGNCKDGDGMIAAEQGTIMGHGSSVGMTAYITRSPGGTQTLAVSFVAPPGTFSMGDFGENVSEYIDAVRSNIPDIHAAR